MLINFPFIPETKESLKNMVSGFTHIKISDSLLPKEDIFIPKQILFSESGLNNNVGLYDSKLINTYNTVSLESDLEIYSVFKFLPVVLKENKPNPYNVDTKYSIQKNLLFNSYGFIKSIEEFMELIGNQLNNSKRNFCVSFSERQYHDDVYRKNGQLYSLDHSKVNFKNDDTLYFFSIFELINNNTYILERKFEMDFMVHLVQLGDMELAINHIDKVHDKDFIDSLNLKDI